MTIVERAKVVVNILKQLLPKPRKPTKPRKEIE